MRVPNLVIAGAPKCGTSSLFSWLSDHPDVCGSRIKETFFLVDRDHPHWSSSRNFETLGLEGYGDYFRHCRGNERYLLDGTTQYLYQRTALEALSALRPPPRLILLFRDPAERIYSAFRYSKHTVGTHSSGSGDLSFSGYVDLLLAGERDRLADHFPTKHWFLARELEFSRYARHLERWIEAIGMESILVATTEAVARDPEGFVRRVCTWLELDDGFYDGYEFRRRNRTAVYRHAAVRSISRGLSWYLPTAFKDRWREAFLRVATEAPPPKTDEDRQAIARLGEVLRPETLRLASLVNLEIGGWATVREGQGQDV